MKMIKSSLSGLVAGGVVLAMVSTLAAQTVEQGTVKVVNIHGGARYMTPDNPNWRPLRTGAVLKPGAIIQTSTSAGSYVDVVLNNPSATAGATPAGASSASASSGGSPPPLQNASHKPHPKVEQDAIRIFENTVLGFDKLTITHTGADRVTETQLDLKHGRILGTVKKLNAASKYEIKIPSGVAGIRGTVYLLNSDGELSVLSSLGDLSQNVPSGSAVLAYYAPDGNVLTQVVADGQQFNAKSGQLAPIPDSTIQTMLEVARSLGFAPGGFFTEFAPDRTVFILSDSTASRLGNSPPASD
jgi:hypothetical protein